MFFFLFLGFLDKNNDLLYRNGKEVILVESIPQNKSMLSLLTGTVHIWCISAALITKLEDF